MREECLFNFGHMLRAFILVRLMKESLLFSLHSIIVNKLRTLLSLLGVTIGIFAVISVFTIFDSMEIYIKKSLESIGDNVVFVRKWPQFSFDFNYPWWEYWKRPMPSVKEFQEIQRRSQCAQAVVFIAATQKKTDYKSKYIDNATIIGSSHDYNKVISIQLATGRYFTLEESNGGRAVAIIGDKVRQALFGNMTNPEGERIRFLGRKVEVIGVFAREGESNIGDSNDDQILVPVQFLRNILNISNDENGATIIAKAKPNVSNEELKDELTGIMRSLRKLKTSAKENFTIEEIGLLAKSFESIFRVFAIAGWVIGMFSLLVGGFGIANIMFVSVRERTSVIGIQKSLGAKRYFILLEFLFEAVFLCILGGLLGLFFVFLGTIAAGYLLDMNLMLTWNNILLAISVSSAIGLISGFIPAWVASRMDPVEAIRTNT